MKKVKAPTINTPDVFTSSYDVTQQEAEWLCWITESPANLDADELAEVKRLMSMNGEGVAMSNPRNVIAYYVIWHIRIPDRNPADLRELLRFMQPLMLDTNAGFLGDIRNG